MLILMPQYLFRSKPIYIPPHAYTPRYFSSKLQVTATAYSCEAQQTDSTPHITASGAKCQPGVMAVSRDLLKTIPYGSKVWMDGEELVVLDTMHRRWRRRVDIVMPSRGAAIRFGVRRTYIEWESTK